MVVLVVWCLWMSAVIRNHLSTLCFDKRNPHSFRESWALRSDLPRSPEQDIGVIQYRHCEPHAAGVAEAAFWARCVGGPQYFLNHQLLVISRIILFRRNVSASHCSSFGQLPHWFENYSRYSLDISVNFEFLPFLEIVDLSVNSLTSLPTSMVLSFPCANSIAFFEVTKRVVSFK